MNKKLIEEFEINGKKFRLYLELCEWEHFGGEHPIKNLTWWVYAKRGKFWIGIAYYRENIPKVPHRIYNLIANQLNKLIITYSDYNLYSKIFEEKIKRWKEWLEKEMK